jgi:hypothetical protein
LIINAQLWAPPAVIAAAPDSGTHIGAGMRADVSAAAGAPVMTGQQEEPAIAALISHTSMGTGLSENVPLPSWPEALSPQQKMPLSCISAHVWFPPAAIAETPVSPEQEPAAPALRMIDPLLHTSTGSGLAVKKPLPN